MRKSLVLAAAATVASLTMATPFSASAAAQLGQVIARGHAAAGVQVRVYAWPADTSLRPGQSVHRVLLGTAAARTTGTYVLRASAATLSAVANGGYVNMEADAGSASRFFTRQTANLADPVTVNLSAQPGTCGPWALQKKFPPAWAIVGATYVLPGASHVRQSFTYLRGQVSSIGVDLSVGGGAFTADGTTAQKATASIAFPGSPKPGNNVYRTRFRMARYKMTCTSGGTTVTDLLLKAVAFSGGMNTQHPAKAPAASACLPLLKGETFATGRGKAYTWPDGMTVDGVKISMRTGYDSSAQVKYKSGASRRICGTSSHGPGLSPLLVVKP